VASDGSFIAAIIGTHIAMNDAAAPVHVCPGIPPTIDIVDIAPQSVILLSRAGLAV
jgi:hypothetical protein